MRLHADTPQQLAAVLRGQRLSAELTQREAGSKVGLLQKTVSSLETDPSGSSIASLYKLLSALQLRLVLEPNEAPPSDSQSPEW
jgi:HTH-type transcriptional regulator/antitoxin HipB